MQKCNISFKNVIIVFMLFIILILSLDIPNEALAETKVLSEQTYYHLDIGVQLAYKGPQWSEKNQKWGDKLSISTTFSMPFEVKVIDVYAKESAKGINYDFGMNCSSARELTESEYKNLYKNRLGSLINVKNDGSSGKTIRFTYDVNLTCDKPIEVVAQGALQQDENIYRLFGNENEFRNQYPKVYIAVKNALEQGFNGTAGENKLYLIFCPVVIEYKKYVEYSDLDALLKLPATAKQGEKYTVEDDSYIDESLTVSKALLERQVGNGQWEIIETWKGNGISGENTGGRVEQSFSEIGDVTYKLTVETTNGQTDTDIKKIRIIDSREINGQAVLKLDKYTYEGHPANALDESTFEVDGVTYSAKRAYEEKVARSSYKATGGTTKKDGLTAAIVTFPKKGTYPVSLNVTLKNTGDRLSDIKTIEVRKTPYVIDELGGFQKQNRKQILTFNIATYPDKPIVDYDITIKDLKSNELISLTKDAPQENGACIKTRTVKEEIKNKYWTTLTVEFLTKYPRYSLTGDNTQNFSYKIKVTDSKGDTDEAYKQFEVLPDKPPIPAINMQTTFLRAEGTNTAKLEAADGSQSDGDQLQRVWSVAEHSPLTGLAPGQNNTRSDIPKDSFADVTKLKDYENLAFGTNQTIGWTKAGVGKTTVKLHVKDVWIEPTLEEYISPSDYLEAGTTMQTDVINIAPKVSIEPLETLQVNIMLMVSKNKLAELRTRTNELQASLIEKGVDGKVSLVTVYPETKQDEEYKIAGSLYNKSSANCKTCNSVYGISDSDYIFSAVPMKINVDSRGYTECSDMHTLIAHDGVTGKEVWRYTVQNKCTVSLDDKGRYVYLIEDDKTTLLNHDNGQYVIDIPVSIPDKPFISNDYKRLYFASDKGIQKLDLETGKMSQLCSLEINIAKLQNGMLTFIAHESQKQFIYGQLDTENEQISTYKYPVLQLEAFKDYNGKNTTDYDCGVIKPTDFDSLGNAIFLTFGGDSQMCISWYADLKAGTQKVLNMQTIDDEDRVMQVGLIKDKVDVGRYAYMQYVDYDNARNRKKGDAEIYVLELDKNKAWEDGKHKVFEKTYRNGSHDTSIIYARYHEDSNKIYILKGMTFGGQYDITRDGVIVTANPAKWTADVKIGFNGTMFGANLETGAYNENYFVGGFWYNSFDSDSKNIIAHTYNMTADQKIEYALYKRGLLGNESQRYIASYGVDVNNYGKIDSFTEENQVINLGKVNIITDIADKIKELGEQSVYRLKIKGDNISKSEILKKVKMTPNTTYEYSYDMIQNKDSMNGLTIAEVDSYGNTIKTKNGALYKEIVEKQDFRLPPKSSFATYEGGSIRKEGYGDTGYRRDAWGDFNVSFNMEEDGYMDFTLYRDGSIDDGGWYSGWYYSISDNGTILEKENHNVNYEKRILFLKKGKHTINFHTHNKGKVGYNSDTVIAIKDIEIGYMTNKQNNSVSSSASGSKTNVLQTVKGTLKSSKDTAMLQSSSLELPYTGAWGIGGCISFLGGRVYDPISYLNNQNTWLQINATNPHRTCNGDITFTAPVGKILIVTFNESNTVNVRWDGTGKSVGQNKFIMMPNEYIRKQYSRSKDWIGGPKLYDFKAILIPIGAYGITGKEMIYFNDSSINRNISFEQSNKDLVKIEEVNHGKWKFTRYTDIGKSNNDSYLSLSTEGKDIDAYISNFVLKAVDARDKITEYVATEKFNKQKALQNWKVKLTGNADAKMELVKPVEKEEEAPLVYKKGQLVKYKILYSDYECDPSKCGYWLYAHTPYNDGEHPKASIIHDQDGNIKSICGEAVNQGTITIDDALAIAKNKGLKILDKPIDRFYVDGKYTVFHWEFDDTSRKLVSGGYPSYDKVSNTAELTFYIEGSANAPWITGISTSPAKVKENEHFSINVGIDDVEKDVLSLTTEVYKDKKLIFTHRKKDIHPIDAQGRPIVHEGWVKYEANWYIWMDNPETGQRERCYHYEWKNDANSLVKTGKRVYGYDKSDSSWKMMDEYLEAEPVGYPVINTGALPQQTQAGKYEVVCTVRDQTGAGLGTYKFIVVSEGKITGQVYHTEQWDINRKKYNLNRFKSEINKLISYSKYMKLKEPRTRGTNVFWSGEKFILNSEVAGSPLKVICSINGTSYKTEMKNSGKKNAAGEAIYTGVLWDKFMINKWGRKEPVELTFIFTATYSGNITKKHEVKVIVDNMEDYWKLHRVF